MSTISKFVFAFTVVVLIAGQFGCSEADDVELEALGCKFYIPNGYDLSPNEKGNIQSMYAGADTLSYPSIQYYPNEHFEDYVIRESISQEILSEERVGHLRFLKVKLFVNDRNSIWDVIASDSAFFASNAMRGSEFPDRFRACAEKIANKSFKFARFAAPLN
jgi:hypothetical protein